MQFTLLHPPGPGPLALGPLTGAAELAVVGTGAACATALIDRLLQPRPDAPLAPGQAALMTVSDRDRLMAQLHRATFGGRIAGTSRCGGCGRPFDFDFDLEALLGAVAPEPADADPDGWFRDGATRFRLPTGADELAAEGRPAPQAAEVIALACVPAADPSARARAERRMARIAPLVELTLRAQCPECGTANPMQFAAQRYFLEALRAERPRLMREIHLLGACYHWRLADILGLARTDRRNLADQIALDRKAAQKAGAA